MGGLFILGLKADRLIYNTGTAKLVDRILIIGVSICTILYVIYTLNSAVPKQLPASPDEIPSDQWMERCSCAVKSVPLRYFWRLNITRTAALDVNGTFVRYLLFSQEHESIDNAGTIQSIQQLQEILSSRSQKALFDAWNYGFITTPLYHQLLTESPSGSFVVYDAYLARCQVSNCTRLGMDYSLLILGCFRTLGGILSFAATVGNTWLDLANNNHEKLLARRWHAGFKMSDFEMAILRSNEEFLKNERKPKGDLEGYLRMFDKDRIEQFRSFVRILPDPLAGAQQLLAIAATPVVH